MDTTNMDTLHICPYCGKEIEKEEILFYEETTQQFGDKIRSDFLHEHGVSGDRFGRKYYKPCFEGDEINVTHIDINEYYPTMLQDVSSNAMTPEQLVGASDGTFSSFGDGDEMLDDEQIQNSNKRTTEEKHRIVQRACPHCHCELPRKFGILPIHHVSMFGIRAAGKTAYLVNLFQQINTQLSKNNLGSVMLENESKLFMDPLIEEYENTGSTPPTAKESRLMPLVCLYKNGDKEAFIVFYDIAGEGTDIPAYVANHRGIQNTELLLLMIDPNMLCSDAYSVAWDLIHKNSASDEIRVVDTVDTFLNEACGICSEYADHLKSVVCVITKMDMVLEKDSDLFGGANGTLEILSDTGTKHRDHVNLSILNQVSNELARFLNRNFGVDLREKIRSAFGLTHSVQLLGVSTSTRIPSPPGDRKIHFEPKSSRLEPKHRIIEPFLVVAMYFGLISAIDGQGNVRWFIGNQQQEVEQDSEQAPDSKAKPKKEKNGFFSKLFGGKK